MRIALRCDASPEIGTGHVIRSLALAEELTGRGDEVLFLGTTSGMTWPEQQIADRGLVMVPAQSSRDGLLKQVRDLCLDAVVLDGYQLSPELGQDLRAAGVVVAAMVDGPFGIAQHADVYIDQNFGAELRERPVTDSVMLAGIEYALLRDVVLDRRDLNRPTLVRPRVLVVFGGSDPFGGAKAVVPLILEAVDEVDIVVVAASRAIANDVRKYPLGRNQRLEVTGLVDDLPGLAVSCTAAISAAGTSIWEFLCLGVPTGLVAVTDNQLVGYREVAKAGLVTPVGELAELSSEPNREHALAAIRLLVTNPQRNAELVARGQATVDGLGRVRVADFLHQIVASRGAAR